MGLCLCIEGFFPSDQEGHPEKGDGQQRPTDVSLLNVGGCGGCFEAEGTASQMQDSHFSRQVAAAEGHLHRCLKIGN